MDVNPWDFWLSSVLLEDRIDFQSEEERLAWRQNQDAVCDYYQQQYALRRKTQKPIPWWEQFVSKNPITWQYLGELQHPFDVSNTNEKLTEIYEISFIYLESDDSIGDSETL